MSYKSFRILITSLSLIIFSGAALAQGGGQAAPTQAQSVTASVFGANIRFAAPGQTLQIRLEIYSPAGELVFDSGQRAGSVLDWQAAQASAPMADGSYLSVVTVRDFNAIYHQRLGLISVTAGQAALNSFEPSALTHAQSQTLASRRKAQKIEALGNDESVTVLREGRDRSVVVAAHDGRDGQVTSTTGAVTIRTGDFFAGTEREQMRVTPDGRVGIGTNDPRATLDVNGEVLARGGVRFEDGTVLKSAPGGGVIGTGGRPGFAGTGTTGKLSKWTDDLGTLGDSVIAEQTGNVGIGTATPKNKLHVVGAIEIGNATPTGVNPTISNPSLTVSQSQFQLYPGGTGANASMAVNIVPRGTGQFNNRAGLNLYGTDFSANQTDYEFMGIRARNAEFVLSTGSGGTGTVRPMMFAAGFLNDGTTNRGQLYLAANGKVGVNTLTPSHQLEVTGNVKIGGAGSSLIFPDGTSMTTAATSSTQTGNQIVSTINNGATTPINDNRISPNLARLGAQNAWTGQNTFVNGLSANGVSIANVGNPVSAADAANKMYVDATTVRFVPGAEQLSVGDANGTAEMINLRGGSTCCSGPGGHTPAWFKVFQNGSFVATGNLGIGVSPMQGKGYRTSWDSYKGAFRSGYADNEWDDANVGFFSWAGGSNSTAIGLYALAYGDTNQAESTSSIVFGSGNQVKGAAGFSAGAANRVCDTYGVALGNNAKSGGPLINGRCDPDTFNIRGLAAVAIGYNVTADQDHTTAMGKFASNNGFQGTFIWSDGSAQASADTFRNTANNEFAVRATGGVRFRTNLGGTTGCNLPAGSGVFNCTSSRTTKENFLAVSGTDVLSRLRAIPVSTWNYISEGQNVRHIGPMAEDFYQQFKLGTGNTSIGVQDLAGVSIAAVKALDERTLELEKRTAEVEKLRTEVDELRATNAAFAARLAALEQNTKAQTKEEGGRE
jgi:trimeric autotransporter adhesin